MMLHTPNRLVAVGPIAVLLFTLGVSHGEPLSPDDPSISESLVSWLRDAGTDFDEGVWTAKVGPPLERVGEADDGDTYEVPELSTWTPEEGFFDGLTDVNGVLFSADVSDLLVAYELIGGDSFEELTLIGVYQTTGNTDRTRPAGIGSFTEGITGEVFNLASDASLRYDNGNNQTDASFHLPDLTYRAATLSSGIVSDYLDGEVITEEAVTGGAFSGLTRNDNLFIGDLRGGINDPFSSTDLHDIFVAEVLVYNSVLSEEQIIGIGEWLQENVATGTGGGIPWDFDNDGMLGLGDMNLLLEQVDLGTNDEAYDITGDQLVDLADISSFISDSDKLNSYSGDANLDGEFNSSDMVQVFVQGEYEDALADNSTWDTGDWNGDREFDSSDMVTAFVAGGYERGKRNAVSAVPEPSGLGLLALGLLGFSAFASRGRSR